MKRSISIALILCLLLCLCACGGKTEPPTEATAPTPAPSVLPLPTPESTREPAPEVTPEPTPEPTPELTPEPKPEPAEGYIEILKNPVQGIYEGPSYDHAKVGIILQATGYTITEEATDDEGNLWGRLKSGIGWVDLSSARTFEGTPPLLTANFADMNRVGSNYREFYPLDESKYAIFTDIRVTAPVSNIELVMLEPFEGTVTESYGGIDSLEAFEPLLTKLIFWGDFTTYGVSLTDENGVNRLFAITSSGRNGELIVREISEYPE